MSEPSASPLQLSVGDRVVYPNQGVCRVTGVDLKEVAGQRLTFVTMRREEDGAVVMVPQNKVQSVGLRKVATSDDIQKVFEFLKSDSDKADLDWKQRARTNTDWMAQGGILGLAKVVKGLQVLSELRPLPAKERELYDTARHLLVLELAASLNVAQCDAEDSIDVILFPPGRERPKRTADEFKPTGPEEDGDLDLGDDLLGVSLDGDLDLPPDEEPAPSDDEATVANESEEAREARRGASSEPEEITAPGEKGAAPAGEPAKRKRGRPPKPKPEGMEAAAPKKRGRPPKNPAPAGPTPETDES